MQPGAIADRRGTDLINTTKIVPSNIMQLSILELNRHLHDHSRFYHCTSLPGCNLRAGQDNTHTGIWLSSDRNNFSLRGCFCISYEEEKSD